jgi:hypothetical protein
MFTVKLDAIRFEKVLFDGIEAQRNMELESGLQAMQHLKREKDPKSSTAVHNLSYVYSAGFPGPQRALRPDFEVAGLFRCQILRGHVSTVDFERPCRAASLRV